MSTNLKSAPARAVPTGAALGAEIVGLDLSKPLSPQERAFVLDSFHKYYVLLFRNQQITEEDQVRFTSYFGKPMEHVRAQRDRKVKEIFLVSNVKENGEYIGALGNYRVTLHSDLSYMERTGRVSMLYAVEVTNEGGETSWCNCYAAYDDLDEQIKQQIKGYRAVHRHYVESQNPPLQMAHPIACTHPVTRRKYLYVGPHLTKYIVNMMDERELLDRLFTHVCQPKYLWRHEWSAGDLIVWDNWGTMHSREPFPENQRRIMKRTQVFNDLVPVEELAIAETKIEADQELETA